MFSSSTTRLFSRYAAKALAAGTLSVGVVSVTSSSSSSASTPDASSLSTSISSPSLCDAAKGNNNNNNNKIVIVGGGTAGIGVAAMLQREGISRNVTIIEPKSVHYYQPLWTLVGGGVKSNDGSVKPMKEVVPANTEWRQRAVTTFQPDQNKVTLDDGSSVEYDYLVVAAGIQIDWGAIPGLIDGLEQPGSGVCSVYDFKYSAKTYDEFKRIKDKASTMIFTFSPTVIKCAGAPQKILWLLEDTLKRAGLRDKHDMQFWTPGKSMFGVPYYAEKLEKIRQERNVKGVFGHKLVKIDVANKLATFQNVDTNNIVTQKYDFLHVAPHMSAPDFLKKSTLTDKDGWLEVDKETMQSTKYPNVFGIGDCTNTPNSKTAAAVISQAPVLIHNLQRLVAGKSSLDGKYNGYASCPLILGRKQVMLAEFGYGGKIMETFNWETGRFPYKLLGTEGWIQRRFFYFLKEQFFPFAYWRLWVHGWWYGTHGPFKPGIDHITGGSPKKD